MLGFMPNNKLNNTKSDSLLTRVSRRALFMLQTRLESVSGAFDNGFLQTWEEQQPKHTATIENTGTDMMFYSQDKRMPIKSAQITTCNNPNLQALGISNEWVDDGQGYWRVSIHPDVEGRDHVQLYKQDTGIWSGMAGKDRKI